MTRTPSATPNLPEPVALSREMGRVRADGWTVERQRGFLEALADCGSVRAACARVGMSAQSAYALRRRSDARAFRQTWDAARAMAAHVLEEAAWDRAIHGTVKQHFYHGELVAETRVYSDRLLLGLIDRKCAAQAMAETDPDVVEQIVADWDGALGRIGTGDWLRGEDELNEEWADQWAELAAEHRHAAAIAEAMAPAPADDPADAPADAHAQVAQTIAQATPEQLPAPQRPAPATHHDSADAAGAGDDPAQAAPAEGKGAPANPRGPARSAFTPTVSTSSTSTPPTAATTGRGANPEFTIPR